MSNRKWKKLRNGSRELCSESDVHAVVEPSKHRGWWWWSTWGREDGDVAGITLGFRDAISKAESEATDAK